ncbi:MAG: HAD-IIIA family hydrolase [Candidatus Aenigmarchaeota archaeon]|nr:HAD-IIIA family hydrolase [Candidatus Aenigmarchaeota archaeon]
MDKILVGIDRDGTINRDVGYLGAKQNWKDELFIYPDAIEGIKLLTENPDVKVVVATNQAGIAHGFLSEEKVKEVNASIDAYLKEKGVYVAGWYYSPFVSTAYAIENGLSVTNPWVKENDMRKPCTGMLKQAAHDLSMILDDIKVYFIGDKDVDVLTGINAGGAGILVHRAHNQKHYELVKRLAEKNTRKIFIVKNVRKAAKIILSHTV